MRSARPGFILLAAALALSLCASAHGAPSVVFNPDAIEVTPNTTFDSPPIVVEEAGDLSAVDIDIIVPPEVTLDTTVSGTSLACLTPGTGTSLFFASWDADTQRIQITCVLGPAARVVESIRFTTSSNVGLQQFVIVKPVGRGSWPADSTFGSLAVLPPHEVTITSGPSVSTSTVTSAGTTYCSVAATDSLGHQVSYQWSDNGAGGSFSPSSTAQNPAYTAPANWSGSDVTITLSATASCSQDPSIKDTGTVNLTVRSHHLNIDAGPSVNPTTVASGGQTACMVDASDSLDHAVNYLWSDNGAGGSFSPSAATQNPTYTAPENNTGSDITVTLRVTVTCSHNASLSTSRTVDLTVSALPPTTVSVTSTPASSVRIEYSQGSTSGAEDTSFNLSYPQGVTGVTLTAPARDGAANPRWFLRWVLDGEPQPEGQASVTFDIGPSDRTAQAVYGTLVGDLDGDGSVGKSDADLILQALFGEVTQTAAMDVNLDSQVNLKDAAWILSHAYAGPGGDLR